MDSDKILDNASVQPDSDRKREEKVQRNFKQVLHDLIVLLRQATDTETVILYWINKDREIFVLETKSTRVNHTMFQDRIAFANLYLNDFKDISEPVQLEVGRHIEAEELTHYFRKAPVRFVNLLPFVNNSETIAMTVMESERQTFTSGQEEAMAVYMNALTHLLQTYLELNDLADNQNQWIDYEHKLQAMYDRLDAAGLLDHTLNEMQELIGRGGASLICRGMGNWHNVLNSRKGIDVPPVGLKLEENTIAYDALSRGEAVYSIHFNANPKRMSPREPLSRGASLAIPVLIDDRRQAVLLVYSENPLVFTEASKHKLINLSRIVSLRLAADEKIRRPDADILANEYSAYTLEILEKTVETELQRMKSFPEIKTWLGYITPADLSAIRTRLSLDELNQLQILLIERLSPQNFGINGYLAAHSDYNYTFVIQSAEADPVTEWLDNIRLDFEEPIELGDGPDLKNENIEFISGFIRLDENHTDAYQAMRAAKTALSEAMMQKKK